MVNSLISKDCSMEFIHPNKLDKKDKEDLNQYDIKTKNLE